MFNMRVYLLAQSMNIHTLRDPSELSTDVWNTSLYKDHFNSYMNGLKVGQESMWMTQNQAITLPSSYQKKMKIYVHINI